MYGQFLQLTDSMYVLFSGVSSLISLLGCAQGDDYVRLNVMLCEAVVAVYLSLLIHGLGTHSGNELFRLAAHPLNNRMWAAVFGGGAKLIVKPKRPPEIAPGEFFFTILLLFVDGGVLLN